MFVYKINVKVNIVKFDQTDPVGKLTLNKSYFCVNWNYFIRYELSEGPPIGDSRVKYYKRETCKPVFSYQFCTKCSRLTQNYIFEVESLKRKK